MWKETKNTRLARQQGLFVGLLRSVRNGQNAQAEIRRKLDRKQSIAINSHLTNHSYVVLRFKRPQAIAKWGFVA